MKTVGLLLILFFASLGYLVGWKCYRLGDFAQELANFTHLSLFGKVPGTAVSPAPCPGFGLPSVASGTSGSATSSGVAG